MNIPETVSIEAIDKNTKFKTNYDICNTILLVTISVLWLIIIAMKCYYIKNQLKQIYYLVNNIRMARNYELKENDIKIRICYYFDNIINVNDLNLDNILLDEIWYENILIYYTAYKTSYGEKPLCEIFDNTDGYVRQHDSSKYLALFYPDEKHKFIFLVLCINECPMVAPLLYVTFKHIKTRPKK